MAEDPEEMLETLTGLPDQCETALRIGQDADLPGLPGEGARWRARQVVMAAMGGSAIGGDLVRVTVARQAGVPFAVCRDYTLPSYVDERTLVFLTSYSGNTEETISAYRLAGEQGCRAHRRNHGRRLAELAASDGVPVSVYPRDCLPVPLSVTCSL